MIWIPVSTLHGATSSLGRVTYGCSSSNTWRHIRVAFVHVFVYMSVLVCVCLWLSLYLPPFFSMSPSARLRLYAGDTLHPATLTLAKRSYFDADDARQMGCLSRCSSCACVSVGAPVHARCVHRRRGGARVRRCVTEECVG